MKNITLKDFMKDYDIDSLQEAIDALEDGQFLSNTGLTMEQVEALYNEAA